ncbi:MAG: PadR family transcriptional regulator [Longimicrobiales bacterium]
MPLMDALTETEQLVLLALLHLGEDAYGVPVQAEIEARSGRRVSLAAVYGTLDRLESRKYVGSWLSDPVPERGGRARKHFRVTAAGGRALRESREAMARMWRGVELHPDVRGR